MATVTAFQATGFQNNAFQIASATNAGTGGPSHRWRGLDDGVRKRKWKTISLDRLREEIEATEVEVAASIGTDAIDGRLPPKASVPPRSGPSALDPASLSAWNRAASPVVGAVASGVADGAATAARAAAEKVLREATALAALAAQAEAMVQADEDDALVLLMLASPV